jgi:hypothetical protein
MRGALEGLFDSIGLETPAYATAHDFLVANLITTGSRMPL